MHSARTTGLTLLLLAFVSCGAAQSQTSKVDPPQPRPELALEYTYAHANAPPGACGCFSLNGGSGEFAWPTRLRGLAIAADVTVAQANGIGANASSLTLSTFTAGARYAPRFKASRFQPFADVLVGLGHTSGSLTQQIQGQANQGSNAFAAKIGGGADLFISRKVSIRLVEADYLVTTFANGGNDHQNLIQVSTGVVFHF